MTRDRRTGLPGVDPLIERHEAEQGRLDELIAVNHAENVAVAVRRDELVAEQDAALRRWSAAKGQLTKAQRNGGAERIAAARARVTEASAEFDRISKATIAELAQLAQGRHDSVSEIFGQMRRSRDTGDAVIDTLEGLRPGTPTDDGATP